MSHGLASRTTRSPRAGPRSGAYIGTSGWAYDEWREGFYAGVPRGRWLEHYAARFDAVEVNATFYHTLRSETLRDWAHRTPPGFRFAIKAHRYLTHIQRLAATADSLSRQRAQAGALGEKLAGVLWQLPQGLQRDLRLLERWRDRIRAWLAEGRVVHVYFDNTARGHAVRNAAMLAALCAPGARQARREQARGRRRPGSFGPLPR